MTYKLKCIIMSASDHRAIASQIGCAIAREKNPSFDVSLCRPEEGCPICDLFIPIVDTNNLDQISKKIALVLQTTKCAVMPLTCNLSREQLLSLVGLGVIDFMTMPHTDAEVSVRVHRALSTLMRKGDSISRDVASLRAHGLIGQSPAFLKQVDMLPRLAGSVASVLVLGETGTGKEVFARAVHYMSARAAKPWVAVNCSAIPADLLESELFGHVRGAFTSAHAARPGLVSEADGGTLFLDEIDSLPYGAQSKLLRFLQDLEFRSVGSDKVCKADVRVIAASNHDLQTAVDREVFRRDLFYRLNVLTLTLPPLRERREDIPLLAAHFLSRLAKKSGADGPSLPAQVTQRLCEHDWPGNVRELEHAMERAVLMTNGQVVRVEDLGLPLTGAKPADESFREAKCRIVQTFERSYIERLLVSCEGNINRAARLAKKNRRAFFALIRKHGVSPEQYRAHSDAARV